METKGDAGKGLTSLLAAEFHGSVAPPDRNNDFSRRELDDYFSLPLLTCTPASLTGGNSTVITFPT